MNALGWGRGGDFRSGLLMAAGLAAAGIAPLILFIELFEWVTGGEWPGLTVADGLALFGLTRVGVETDAQRFADLMMAAPLTVALFILGVCTFLAGASIGNWERERQLRRELDGKSIFSWFTIWGAKDVGYPAAIRLLFLDLLLAAFLWVGISSVVGELVLLAFGIEARWLGLYGLILVATVAGVRVAAERKLNPE